MTDQRSITEVRKLGACQVTFNSNTISYQAGDVTLTLTDSWEDVFVSEFPGPVDSHLTRQMAEVTMTLAQDDADTLGLLIPVGTDVTESATKYRRTFGKVPGYAASNIAYALKAHPVIYDTDLTRDLHLHKAYPAGDPIEFKINREGDIGYEVTFRALVDTGKSDGDYLGAVGDLTASADTTAPVVASTDWSAATNGTTGAVVITFTEAGGMDTTSLIYGDADGATVAIIDNTTPASPALKAGSIAITGATNNVVTFTPTAAWTTGDDLLATVTTGVKDLAGNYLAALYLDDNTV